MFVDGWNLPPFFNSLSIAHHHIIMHLQGVLPGLYPQQRTLQSLVLVNRWCIAIRQRPLLITHSIFLKSAYHPRQTDLAFLCAVSQLSYHISRAFKLVQFTCGSSWHHRLTNSDKVRSVLTAFRNLAFKLFCNTSCTRSTHIWPLVLRLLRLHICAFPTTADFQLRIFSHNSNS